MVCKKRDLIKITLPYDAHQCDTSDQMASLHKLL